MNINNILYHQNTWFCLISQDGIENGCLSADRLPLYVLIGNALKLGASHLSFTI